MPAGDADGTEEVTADERREGVDGKAAGSADTGSKERIDTAETPAKGKPAAPDAPREAPSGAAPAAPATAGPAAGPPPGNASTDWNSLMDRFAALKRR